MISDRTFYVTITDADIGSLKSLHTLGLFDKYLDHMMVKFDQNRMERTQRSIQNFEVLAKNG